MEIKTNNVPITVLMSFHDEKESYLRQSIESILTQTFSDFEFLIIDDASNSKLCKNIVNEYVQKDSRIKLIENDSNIGLTKTLNKGLLMANGTYVARIDADDSAEKNRLERQFNFLADNPEYVLCGSWATVIDENGNIIGKKEGCVDHEDIRERIVATNFFTHSSLFFKKSEILALGGYDENLKKSQDYDLLLKLATKHKIKNLPEYLCQYRFRNDSISFSNNKAQEKNSLKIRMKALREYGYPRSYYLKMARPLFLHFLVPSFFKLFLMKLSWKI